MVVASQNEFLMDPWAPLSYKSVMSERTGVLGAPNWVGEHARRLQAYKVLQAYRDNISRHFLLDQDEPAKYREYGDAELLVVETVGALLGDQQVLFVEGAEAFDSTETDEDDEESEEDDELFVTNKEARAALDRQNELQDWAQTERLIAKMMLAEEDAVGLGDGVYTLGWDSQKERVIVRQFDPGFYFPVLSDDQQEYPTKVHIAWEIEDEEEKSSQVRIRRITWELRDIEPARNPEGAFVEPEEGQESPGLIEGDRFDNTPNSPTFGKILRQYGWNEDPSSKTCYLTDVVFEVDQANKSLEDFDESNAIYEVTPDGRRIKDLDLMIDFLPVIHIPNTLSKHHFGKASLATVLQLLDDLYSADSDLHAAARVTGTPVLGVSGVKPGDKTITWGPGSVIGTGDGRLDVVDLSNGVKVLAEYIKFLLKRLSVNSRMPEGKLGRIDPSEVKAGIIMALSFGPLQSMVNAMRLVRDEKYPIMLKFVQRFWMANGIIEPGPDNILRAGIRFGRFLPADKKEAVEIVTALLTKKSISLRTGLEMLVEVGIPIDDISQEIARIQAEDIESAEGIVAATGNVKAAAERLGVDPGGLPEPPPIEIEEPPTEE